MASLLADDRGVITSCAACGQKNRLAYERLSDVVRCGRCKQPLVAPASPVEVKQSSDFDQLIARSSIPIVVDFWAPWCGPCRALGPVLEQLADENAGKVKVVKVNTDENQDLAQRLGIQSIPTLEIFAGGHEVARTAGARPAADIEALIDQAVEKLSRAS
jgi:thioredoxin 2